MQCLSTFAGVSITATLIASAFATTVAHPELSKTISQDAAGQPAVASPTPKKQPRMALLDLGTPGPENYWGNIIGISIVASEWKAAAKKLADLGTNVVIMRANARSSSIYAAEKMAKVLEEDFLPRFRVILWLEKLDGDATLAVWTLPEIVMRPFSKLGPALKRYHTTGCISGSILNHQFELAEHVSQISERDPTILRSMMTLDGLSFDIDRTSGKKKWQKDSIGEFILCLEGSCMAWNSPSAVMYGIAAAEAADIEELLHSVDLRDAEIVGKDVALQLRQSAIDAQSSARQYLAIFREAADKLDQIKNLSPNENKVVFANIKSAIHESKLILKQYPGFIDLADPEALENTLRTFKNNPSAYHRYEFEESHAWPSRVAILDFGDEGEDVHSATLGIGIRAKDWEDAALMLMLENPDVVIVRVNTGGGSYPEAAKFIDLWEVCFLPYFRTVLWVRSCRNASTLATYPIPEVVFDGEGYFGRTTCDGWGAPPVWRKFTYDQLLDLCNRASDLAGRNPNLLYAMQTFMPLSSDPDPITGTLHWRLDDCGTILIWGEYSIPGLNPPLAQAIGFSKGTADSFDDLMCILGIENYELVGDSANSFIRRSQSSNSKAFDIFHEGSARINGHLDKAESGKNVSHEERIEHLAYARARIPWCHAVFDHNQMLQDYFGADCVNNLSERTEKLRIQLMEHQQQLKSTNNEP